jgi:hypothetical protein
MGNLAFDQGYLIVISQNLENRTSPVLLLIQYNHRQRQKRVNYLLKERHMYPTRKEKGQLPKFSLNPRFELRVENAL